jgi:hypothetical protein
MGRFVVLLLLGLTGVLYWAVLVVALLLMERAYWEGRNDVDRARSD